MSQVVQEPSPDPHSEKEKAMIQKWRVEKLLSKQKYC